MKNTYNYIAEAHAGKSEKARLALQHQIFGPGTERFLAPLLKPGMTVLVVGCGTGEETCFIAKAVGPSGKVVAIDLNQKQLAEARAKLEENKITHVELCQMDLMELSTLPYLFDLAFSRFVLVHIPDPIVAIESILTKLKPGGRLACEEATVSAAYSTPPIQVFSKHIDLLIHYSRAIGVDFDLGIRLKEMFVRAGLEEVSEQVSQPLMVTAEEKRIVPMSAAASSKGYISRGLITEEEIEQLVKDLDSEVVHNPDCSIGQVQMHQIMGTRSK
jgi:ubiquinone/menaquinone biosynthesis C-methylase UbiE